MLISDIAFMTYSIKNKSLTVNLNCMVEHNGILNSKFTFPCTWETYCKKLKEHIIYKESI